MQIYTEISKIVLHFALFVFYRVRSGYICKRKGRVKIYFYPALPSSVSVLQSLPSSVSDAHFGLISPAQASEFLSTFYFQMGSTGVWVFVFCLVVYRGVTHAKNRGEVLLKHKSCEFQKIKA